MKVYILFGLGLGDDEDAWEVTAVFVSEAKAKEAQAINEEDGCTYKVEAWDVVV